MMIRKVIVINSTNLDQANEFCNEIGADGNTFSVSLFNSQNELSNYVCNWLMNDDQYQNISNNQMFILFNTLDEALTILNLHREESQEVQ